MDRTKGIGGSDANKIYNGDWLDLNRIKRGISEPEDLSWVVPVQIGIATEKLNLDFMAHDLGVTYKQSIDLPQHEFMTGQMDAITSGGIPVECKHTHDRRDIYSIAEQYHAQLNHYMMLFNYMIEKGTHPLAKWCKKIDYMILSVIFGNAKHESMTVDIDTAFCNELYKREKAFWYYVEKDEDPTGFDIFDDKTPKNIILNGMRTIDYTENKQWESVAKEYKKCKQRVKEIELSTPEYRKTKELNDELKSMIENDVRKVTGHGISATRNKRNSIVITIDK